eukprot:gnl/TRDRNA2_/TRDRNA2_179064_c0_seq1.p1 gnl/TRDRNA2_/TRDRNA2_179064_c0~~gnl/TRDRNA2_/TRDRNA2_179064_c0_seq1.p1  ORF type:complete len:697 (+),score=170.16 gnl/TRDRNA2_/TRDRNA2_179064_c0_seq1:80-2170(+)
MTAALDEKDTEDELYPFHNCNIHENRFIAKVCCAFPLAFFLVICTLVLLGAFKYNFMLLVICAILNTTMWLWVTGTAACGIWGSWIAADQIRTAQEGIQEVKVDKEVKDRDVFVYQETARGPSKKPPGDSGSDVSTEASTTPTPPTTAADAEVESGGAHAGPSDDDEELFHLIVLPNYKEEEEMLEETLVALKEAADSRTFRIVLAMEAREKEAEDKANRLKEKFSCHFAWIQIALHPANLEQEHLDGSSGPEVPGKASNLKWGVKIGWEECKKEASLDLSKVMLTIADADCIFHPGYFRLLRKEHIKLKNQGGNQQEWTMWQAPQLPYRNFWVSPIPSRTWGYVSTMYEFGGVSSLACGGHHMVFSSYSLPLNLAMNAQAWDGDVIAEDHHAFIKCFFYAIHAEAKSKLKTWEGVVPRLYVKPVFLPVKSTSCVSSESYWQTWVDRWNQATRHTQGVAEFSYALLATYDCIMTLPWNIKSFHLFFRMWKVVFRLWCMHMLPILQGVALFVLTLYWYIKERQVPMCPDRIWVMGGDKNPPAETILCGLAGAWCLVWPMFIPLMLITFSNYLFVKTMFLDPYEKEAHGKKKLSLWTKQNGGNVEDLPDMPECTRWGSIRHALAVVIIVDCVVLVGPIMVPYGMITMLLAYWNVCFKGNQFTYIAATKAMSDKAIPNYGSTEDSGTGGSAKNAAEKMA